MPRAPAFCGSPTSARRTLIEVRNDPAPVIAGGDPQPEAAVREALRLLETEKVTLREEPAPPVRWRRPAR